MKKGISIALACLLFAFTFATAETAAQPSVSITLTENPTTGYTWKVAVSDDAILTVKDEGFTSGENAGKAEGVGGTHTWTITGKAEGDATVTITLGQDWDGGEKADTLTYTYHVDAALALTQTAAQGVPERYQPGVAAVVLTENPTTGYQWAYKASAEGILTPVRDEYVAPGTDAKDGQALVGQGGYHVWTFTGAKEGDVTLTFEYARSWEAEVKPDATVTYTFHVAKDLSVTQTEISGDYEAYDPLTAKAE